MPTTRCVCQPHTLTHTCRTGTVMPALRKYLWRLSIFRSGAWTSPVLGPGILGPGSRQAWRHKCPKKSSQSEVQKPRSVRSKAPSVPPQETAGAPPSSPLSPGAAPLPPHSLPTASQPAPSVEGRCATHAQREEAAQEHHGGGAFIHKPAFLKRFRVSQW